MSADIAGVMSVYVCPFVPRMIGNDMSGPYQCVVKPYDMLTQNTVMLDREHHHLSLERITVRSTSREGTKKKRKKENDCKDY